MSDAELHVIQQRLVEVVRCKAKRGELRRRLPTGYIWDEAGRTQITPNDEVVQAIRLVFDRFDQLGTAHQTHVSLVEDGIAFPVQSGGRGEVSWQTPSYRNIHSLLTNPTYAGVYAYGRRQTQEGLDENHNPIKRQREVQRGGTTRGDSCADRSPHRVENSTSLNELRRPAHPLRTFCL